MGTYQHNEERRLPVSQLRIGMYVSGLDRPWNETDFPLQGLTILSAADIDRLAGYCEHVFIDVRKSVNYRHGQTPNATEDKASTEHKTDAWKKNYCVETYPVTTSFNRELNSAKYIIDGIARELHRLIGGIDRQRHPDPTTLNERVTELVESVLRNPDALAWLCRVKLLNYPLYLHATRLAVWGCIVGRQLGLNRFALRHLTMALMMSSIGKSFLPESTLEAYSWANLPDEYPLHLNKTLFYLKSFKFSSNDTLDTVSKYCERLDGSGYPSGLRGNAIPFLARVAGLVESFELLIHPFNLKHAIAPASAVILLNKHKDQLFDGSLVEAFIRAIGIYPTGTLVELNDERIGIVTSQTYEKRLRATVLPLTTSQLQFDTEALPVDLNMLAGKGKAKASEPLFITKGLPANRIPESILLGAHQRLYEQPQGWWQKMKRQLNW